MVAPLSRVNEYVPTIYTLFWASGSTRHRNSMRSNEGDDFKKCGE